MGDAKAKEAQLEADSATQIANVSRLLRDAIAAAIPVAPDQYMTIAVPGEVIDVRNIATGGTYVYDQTNLAWTPTSVAQAEAKLVDRMMPLANVMIGNTGKSVSRSYTRALDCLVARKASYTGAVGQIRSPGSEVYKDSMAFLTKQDANGFTPVAMYMAKQAAWAAAQNAWDQAKIDALNDAKTQHPDNVIDQQQAYNDWSQTHYRLYKTAVQGRYIDWVSNGYKNEVEYHFGVVDVDSIMARVENSKESVRNSTIVDADGSNEVIKVTLSPKNWAKLCQDKQLGWFKKNDEYSLDQIDAEIQRLQRLLLSYQVLQDVTTGTGSSTTTPTFPINDPTASLTSAGEELAALKTAFSDIYTAEAAMNKQKALAAAAGDETAQTAYKLTTPYTDAIQALTQKREALNQAIKEDKDWHANNAKYQLATLTGVNFRDTLSGSLTSTITTITNQIAGLEIRRAQKMSQNPPVVPAFTDAHADKEGDGTQVAGPGSELAAEIFGINADGTLAPSPTTPGALATLGTSAATTTGSGATAAPTAGVGDTGSDPWTTITAAFSAADQSSSTSSSSWGMSVGGGAGWGLWSVGGSYAYDQSQTDSVSDMASCDISVSFSALVVNIERPWLYGELFNDAELDVADGILLSPGAGRLKELMASQNSTGSDPMSANIAVVAELAQYNTFPAFPTSFIVAADTTIEFNGNTQHIEDHFSAQSSSGSVSVGWGPFSVSGSFHQSSVSQTYQVQTTATGCKLTFGAPQVIGWVSQINPQLPRLANFEPMVQNTVIRTTS